MGENLDWLKSYFHIGSQYMWPTQPSQPRKLCLQIISFIPPKFFEAREYSPRAWAFRTVKGVDGAGDVCSFNSMWAQGCTCVTCMILDQYSCQQNVWRGILMWTSVEWGFREKFKNIHQISNSHQKIAQLKIFKPRADFLNTTLLSQGNQTIKTPVWDFSEASKESGLGTRNPHEVPNGFTNKTGESSPWNYTKFYGRGADEWERKAPWECGFQQQK